MQKIILGIIFFFFGYLTTQAQYEGYRGLVIGQRISLNQLKERYNLFKYPTYELLLKIKPIAEQQICNYNIDYIDVKLNSDSTIEYLEAFTEESVFKDIDEFELNYQTIITCIVNTVGSVYEYDSGVHNKEGKTHVSWKLNNNIYLVVYGRSPNILERLFKNRFKFVWFKSEPQKMW